MPYEVATGYIPSFILIPMQVKYMGTLKLAGWKEVSSGTLYGQQANLDPETAAKYRDQKGKFRAFLKFFHCGTPSTAHVVEFEVEAQNKHDKVSIPRQILRELGIDFTDYEPLYAGEKCHVGHSTRIEYDLYVKE